MKRRWFGRAVMFVALVAIMIAALGWVVMSLWNALLPGLFGWPTLSWSQALGLLVLSRILFGGLRPGFGRGGHWRDKMRARWADMTPAEREKLRDSLRTRCMPWHSGTDQD